MITVSWSLQRADHGEQPVWMAVVLAAMLGQIGLPGGGFGVGYSSENGIGNPVLPFRFPAVPQGQNPVTSHIPVARISDMLLNPGGEYDFDGQRRDLPRHPPRLLDGRQSLPPPPGPAPAGARAAPARRR